MPKIGLNLFTRVLPQIVMESILQETLFFVALKKRPTEALFRAYKKSVFQKILEWKAGLGT
jgi:hypothetical protein